MKYLAKGTPSRVAQIYALIERIDVNISRLLLSLEKRDTEKEMLMIFRIDNGGVSMFWKGGIRGNKASPYEVRVRTPLFARCPSAIPADGAVEGQAFHGDVLPTFCELAGVDLPANRTIDGRVS